MQALAGAGFHAVTMDQMRANWTAARRCRAGKPIVVSFDNGYQSQYTNALPVLRRLGWVGVENMQLTGLPPSQGGLSADRSGPHRRRLGARHPGLQPRRPDHPRRPASCTTRWPSPAPTVQRRYHVPVNWFCYPSGHYNADGLAAVKAAGYAGSTTVVPGWAQPGEDPYRLPRLRVLGGTSRAAAERDRRRSARTRPAGRVWNELRRSPWA